MIESCVCGKKRVRIFDGSSGIITSYKDEYAVGQDNVIGLNNPGNPDGVADALTDLLRSGARQMLAAAVEAEIQEVVKRHQGLLDEQDMRESCAMATCQNAAPRRGWTILKCHERGIGAANSDRRSCRFICAERNPLRNCCPGCIRT